MKKKKGKVTNFVLNECNTFRKRMREEETARLRKRTTLKRRIWLKIPDTV